MTQRPSEVSENKGGEDIKSSDSTYVENETLRQEKLTAHTVPSKANNSPGGEDASKEKQQSFSVRKEIFSWIKVVLAALVISFLLNHYIIISAEVPTGSMENTVQIDDRIIASRLSYYFHDPKRGDIIVFDFPDDESFDITVKVTLVRSHSKKLNPVEGYKRFVGKATSFDFIKYGSQNTYELSFRIVRFPISNSTYECIVTNLPADEFPTERIKKVFNARWGVESSFRKLKYTIGLNNFHASKPEYIKQEIWARLIAYNITETLINHTVVEQKATKYEYKVNFSMAAHICRVFLHLTTKKDSIDVMSLLQKEMIPIRNGRQYPRLKTAHFRKPRYFTYRAA